MGTLLEFRRSPRRCGRQPASLRQRAAIDFRHSAVQPSKFDRDRDLLPIALTLWLLAVVRVGSAFAQHEVFDAEATIALVCIFLLPWAFVSRSASPERKRHLSRSRR